MAYVLESQGNLNDHLPFGEFTYYNSYYASIEMAQFKAL